MDSGIPLDFSQPIEADFIVALKARSGEFCIFVEAFTRSKGKDYLKHTPNIEQAKRFSRLTAEDVVEKVKEYRCTGRVERVSPDNRTREVVRDRPRLVPRPQAPGAP